MALFGCFAIPLYCLLIIDRYTLALVIHQREIELGIGMPLLSGTPVPVNRFQIIDWHTFTHVIHQGQVVLRTCVVLFRSLGIKLYGSSVIKGDALAFVIHIAQCKLRHSIALLRRFGIPLRGFLIGLQHAVAIVEMISQLTLRTRVTCFSLGYQQRDRRTTGRVLGMLCGVQWSNQRKAQQGCTSKVFYIHIRQIHMANSVTVSEFLAVARE